MIFSDPIPFAEAIEHQLVKQVLAVDASAADLAGLAPAIRERAFFSARTTHAGYLQRAHNLITQLVSPETIVDPDTGETRFAGPGESVNPAVIRNEMKQYLASIGYEPDPGKRGGLQDLSSDRRIDLIIEMQEGFSAGYGTWMQAQNSGVLKVWPADELYRAEERRAKREWGPRWNQAISALAGQTSAKPVDDPNAQSGMVALKNDPIWLRLSRFGLPYPPFDYQSGMRVRDVMRSKAIALGVLRPTQEVQPQQRDLNEGLAASIPDDMPQGIVDAVMVAFGERVAIEAGKFILQGVG